MAYNIPIMSGLKIPNEEELVNLTPEQKAAINKLYLLHSKHVEVDCIKPKRDENGNIIVDEDNNPEVEKEYVDLATVLGQLAKTSGVIHWNSNGLNETGPDERLYPELEINYDEINRQIQDIIDHLDISEEVNQALIDNHIQRSISEISTTLTGIENTISEIEASFTQVNAISTTMNNIIENVNTINDIVNDAKKRVDNLYNYNYLDNSNFENPVNQRGQISYSINNKNCIDRWQIKDNATVNILDNGIEILNGHIEQHISSPIGIENFTVLATKIDGTKIELNNAITQNNNILTVSLGSGRWKNIGLYEGSKTVETWSYVPKSYSDEYAICTQYFYRFRGAAICSIPYGNRILLYCSTPLSMRTNPTGIITELSRINIRGARIGYFAPENNGTIDAGNIHFDVNLAEVLNLSINAANPDIEDLQAGAFGWKIFEIRHSESIFPISTDIDGTTCYAWYHAEGMDIATKSYKLPQSSWYGSEIVNTQSIPGISPGSLGYCQVTIDFDADLYTE